MAEGNIVETFSSDGNTTLTRSAEDRHLSIFKPIGRVVGGTNVQSNTYPWFARQIYQVFGSNETFFDFCGGSLIASDFVLTAGHCVDGNTNFEFSGGYEIGSLCPNSKNNCGQTLHLRSKERFWIHPDFKTDHNFNYDFALVKLKTGTNIPSVRFDRFGASKKYRSRKKLSVVGLGVTSNGSSNAAVRLKHAEVNYRSNKRCRRSASYDLTANMMCAIDKGKDSCVGDSGGPLFDAERNLIVGIVSWGDDICGRLSYPGVYARINSVSDWIIETVCEHSRNPPGYCNRS